MTCIRTSIDPVAKKRALFRGLPFAAVGALLLLFYGTRGVSPLGVLGLIGALALIAFGSRPYRKLCRLEISPDELVLEDNHLSFIHRSKVLFAIPLEKINSVRFEGHIVLGTDEGDICFAHFDEKACNLLQSRLHKVVELDKPGDTPVLNNG